MKGVLFAFHGCLQSVTQFGFASTACPTCHGTPLFAHSHQKTTADRVAGGKERAIFRSRKITYGVQGTAENFTGMMMP